jgi:tetraacyldisaccharide 4'-kinase
LREPLATALRRAQAVVLIGEDRAGLAGLIAGRCPILPARLIAPDPGAVAGKPVYALAGIGRPEKFFASLEDAGALIAGRREFSDHHPFSGSEMAEVLAAAAALGAIPVTTAKDRLRLPAGVRDRVQVFEVKLAFDDPAAVEAMLARLRPRAA